MQRQALHNGSPGSFDFTAHMRRLCGDMVGRLPELAHIDLDRVAIAFRQARKRVPYGIQATLTPLRFEGGSLYTRRLGRWWTVPKLYNGQGDEFLYILSFYLPRFQDHVLREKLVTIFHELWHISPQFDGDLRRHPGRCYAHSGSQTRYDAAMEQLVDRWLDTRPDESLYGFLQLSFADLYRRHGAVCGVKIAIPKLIPLAEPPARAG